MEEREGRVLSGIVIVVHVILCLCSESACAYGHVIEYECVYGCECVSLSVRKHVCMSGAH